MNSVEISSSTTTMPYKTELLEFLTVHARLVPHRLAKDPNITFAAKTPYLGTDLGRNADKLRVGCKCRQILHSFDQGCGGNATLIAVVFGEIPVQGLMGEHMETLSHGDAQTTSGHHNDLLIEECGLMGY